MAGTRAGPNAIRRFFAETREKSIMAVMLVRGDESQDETAKRVVSIGCVRGTENQWNDFVPRWKTLLKGKVFHGADWETDEGDFKGCEHQDNLKLYAALAILLAESKLDGFAVALNLTDYRSVFPADLSQQPYFFCFMDVLKYFYDSTSKFSAVPRKLDYFVVTAWRSESKRSKWFFSISIFCGPFGMIWVFSSPCRR